MGMLTMSANRDDNFSILILKLSCQVVIQSQIHLNRPYSNFFESLIVSFYLRAINILYSIIRNKWWTTNIVEVKVKLMSLKLYFLIRMVISFTYTQNTFKRLLILIICASPSWFSVTTIILTSNGHLLGWIRALEIS